MRHFARILEATVRMINTQNTFTQLKRSAIGMQNGIRTYYQRKQFFHLQRAALLYQSGTIVISFLTVVAIRGYLSKMLFLQSKKSSPLMAAITLQRGTANQHPMLIRVAIRLYIGRRSMSKLRKASLALQIPIRRVIASTNSKRLHRSVFVMQCCTHFFTSDTCSSHPNVSTS